ncbi:MAG: hypothetical protein ACLGG0_09690 [Bacteriovoracia bacterium]
MTKTILGISLLLTSQVFAGEKLYINGEDLRGQLIEMYESSTTPYPIEEEARSDADAPSFKACAFIKKNGQIIVEDSEHYILKYRTLVSSAAGPLLPAVYKYQTQLSERGLLDSFIENGAKFKDGVLDFTNFSLSRSSKSPDCKDGTSVKQHWLNTETAINPEGTDFVYRVTCNDGTVTHEMLKRKSGEYLVFKILGDTYGYCWR